MGFIDILVILIYCELHNFKIKTTVSEDVVNLFFLLLSLKEHTRQYDTSLNSDIYIT